MYSDHVSSDRVESVSYQAEGLEGDPGVGLSDVNPFLHPATLVLGTTRIILASCSRVAIQVGPRDSL